MYIFLGVLFILFIAVYIFLKQPKFGALPKGERLQSIKASPNFKNGKFQNQSFTPDLTEGSSYYSVMKEFLFNKNKRKKPAVRLPSIKENLHALSLQDDLIVWFGHSSYYMQIAGRKFLVDPVLSGAASPVSFTTKSFNGTDVYTADDIPVIDYLFISHDHWDHLDYITIKKLQPKIGKIICGSGTGAHFERWGFSKESIIEKEWNEHVILEDGVEVFTVPARHFSGRGFSRNRSLWMSYVLSTPTKKIFIGGDSGYDAHFKKAGQEFGPFDLAILECGQYDKSWKYIHMMPEEVLQVAQDLKANTLLPAHWGKFQLANHDWDAPIKELVQHNSGTNLPLLTPLIGSITYLDKPAQQTNWWQGLD